jgi:voltage-gated sodium channel
MAQKVQSLFLSNKFILSLILVNALVLFIEGFKLNDSVLESIIYLDNAITVLFAVEAIIKLRHFGTRGYFGDKWNILDFTLVLISIPVPIAYVLGGSSFNLSALLALRLLRLFRLFRFMRFIPEIDKLVTGAARATKASIVVLFGFFVYTFMLGIISFYLFSSVSSEYFGNPLVSIYSVFKIFTIEGWFEIPEAIAQNYNALGAGLTKLYFMTMLFSGGIIGLSLINSIFVEEMMSDNTNEIEENMKRLEEKIDLLVAGTKSVNK